MADEIKQIFELVVSVIKLIKSKRRDRVFHNRMQNLTTAQVYVLYYLTEKDAASMSDLAKYADVKMPTMTDNVDKLVREGMVKREHAGNDRRKVMVMMTEKGNKLMADHMKNGLESLDKIFGTMKTAEKQHIIQLLTYLKNSLEKV